MENFIASISEFGWGKTIASLIVVFLFVSAFIWGGKDKGGSGGSGGGGGSTPPPPPPSDPPAAN